MGDLGHAGRNSVALRPCQPARQCSPPGRVESRAHNVVCPRSQVTRPRSSHAAWPTWAQNLSTAATEPLNTSDILSFPPLQHRCFFPDEVLEKPSMKISSASNPPGVPDWSGSLPERSTLTMLAMIKSCLFISPDRRTVSAWPCLADCDCSLENSKQHEHASTL